MYQQSDAAGFIRLFGLSQRVRALKDQELARQPDQTRRTTTAALTPGAGDQRDGPPPRIGRRETHKLWGGRFGGESAPALDALNRSIDVDFRLWPFDIQPVEGVGDGAVGRRRVSRSRRATQIERGLDAVAACGSRTASATTASDEDVHTLIDRLLHDEVGDVASKLHTGRSRNDQVATATRLWSMDACDQTRHRRARSCSR